MIYTSIFLVIVLVCSLFDHVTCYIEGIDAKTAEKWEPLNVEALYRNKYDTSISTKQYCNVDISAIHASPNDDLPLIATDMTDGQHVYVSLTTISSRVDEVGTILCNFLGGSVLPTKIFVILSEDKYLLDEGVAKDQLPDSLVYMAMKYSSIIEIVYTDNIGPHRKLLPVLFQFWDFDNVIICTFDDDFKPTFSFHYSIEELIKYYLASGRNSVVALRSRRIGLCDENMNLKQLRNVNSAAFHVKDIGNISVSLYKGWNCCNKPGQREMLVLPTGVGGVLYRPNFFNSIVFHPIFRKITATNDDIMFRLGTMINHVDVVGACREVVGSAVSGLDKLDEVRSCPYSIPEIPQILVSAQRRPNASLRGGMSMFKSKSPNKMLNNDLMWQAGTRFLKERGLLNFEEDILSKYAKNERSDCLIAGKSVLETYLLYPKQMRTNAAYVNLFKNCSVHICQKKYISTGEV